MWYASAERGTKTDGESDMDGWGRGKEKLENMFKEFLSRSDILKKI